MPNTARQQWIADRQRSTLIRQLEQAGWQWGRGDQPSLLPPPPALISDTPLLELLR